MQLIPARGRLLLQFSNSIVPEGCSLAPRGDGYNHGLTGHRRIQIQLSPARGRLRVADAFDGFHDEMQLSPARGLRPYVFSGKFPSFY